MNTNTHKEETMHEYAAHVKTHIHFSGYVCVSEFFGGTFNEMYYYVVLISFYFLHAGTE